MSFSSRVDVPLVLLAQVGVGAVVLVEAVLPLDDHAQVLVVQDHGLHIQLMHKHGRELLRVHHEGAVAVDVDHDLGAAAVVAVKGRPGSRARDGRPKPIAPRPPLVTQCRAFSNAYHWAPNIWCCPTPVETIALPSVSSTDHLGAMQRGFLKSSSQISSRAEGRAAPLRSAETQRQVTMHGSWKGA